MTIFLVLSDGGGHSAFIGAFSSLKLAEYFLNTLPGGRVGTWVEEYKLDSEQN